MRFFFDTEFNEDGTYLDLISIGIVAANGQEYYAEPHLSPDALERVRNNAWVMAHVVPHLDGSKTYKPRAQVAAEVLEFCRGGEPEFWANCGAYDWVALNQLYGPMIAHPKPWPFFCNDIAQEAERSGISRRSFPKQTTLEHHALTDARWTQETYWWIQNQAGKMKESY